MKQVIDESLMCIYKYICVYISEYSILWFYAYKYLSPFFALDRANITHGRTQISQSVFPSVNVNRESKDPKLAIFFP